ncbi:hypothetical protein [Anatilimnocola floriformis]|uniref:hypothetical protein n=1 Tax=Anatilimnocola floriformis TaxID=2948575 RepID=UPI0020C3EFEF|nr:hypothetical protein [Anatilimnocola floriformis]
MTRTTTADSATNPLGRLLFQRQRTLSELKWSLLAAAVAIVLGIAGCAVSLLIEWQTVKLGQDALMLSSGAVGAGVLLAGLSWFAWRAQLFCYEHGVVRVSALGGVRQLRFEDLESISFARHRYAGTLYLLSLYPHSNTASQSLTHNVWLLQGEDVEMQSIRDFITRMVLENMRAELEQTGTVAWTPLLRITRAGIEHVGKADDWKLVPWANLRFVLEGDTGVHVYDSRMASPVISFGQNFPNFWPGLRLAEQQCEQRTGSANDVAAKGPSPAAPAAAATTSAQSTEVSNTTHELGRLLFRQQRAFAEAWWMFLPGAGLLLLAVVPVALWILNIGSADALERGLAMGLGAALCGSAWIGYLWASLFTQVRCFETGIVYSTLLGTRQLRFADLESLTFAKRSQHTGRGVYSDYFALLRPIPITGVRPISFHVDGNWRRADIEALRDHIAAILAQKMLLKLQQTGTVDWTPLMRITRTGLECLDNREWQMVPWTNLRLELEDDEWLKVRDSRVRSGVLQVSKESENFYPGLLVAMEQFNKFGGNDNN